MAEGVSDARPMWVIGHSLAWNGYDCCSNAEPFPFKCAECGAPFVRCLECDTLYNGLPDLRVQANFTSRMPCPRCGAPFEYHLTRSRQHRISRQEWIDAGLARLLDERFAPELFEILTLMAQETTDYLARGMLSTAKARWFAFRNLAEALEDQVSDAASHRARGREVACNERVPRAVAWAGSIADARARAFAVLGIMDAVFPETEAKP